MSAKADFDQARPWVVLVAEDDPNDELFLRMGFTEAAVNATVLFVNSGERAIAYLKGLPPFDDSQRYPRPDLLLLDLQMPRVCGLEVLQWLQAQPESRRVPVVVFTGSLSPRDCEQALALGARACFEKATHPARWVPIVHQLQAHCLPKGDTQAG
jgi:two-component system response regulator